MQASDGAEVSCHQESLRLINQDGKFLSRIMSKETSMANSSSRVYYGGASGAIPFMWESCPGTPKNASYDDASFNPPLTPPPSHDSTLKSKPAHKNVRPTPTLSMHAFFLNVALKSR
ncbi:hypothetical protein Tsubulata_006936 [Turnera subulata]|uniref:Uncharacterized protein n=1 Tax=Turnera subulata TaxID=218843 RepID=A0A9Q0F5J4_9ROSI|nr:hypothetical protein Tsubulata_006936 [Turnera subulata]